MKLPVNLPVDEMKAAIDRLLREHKRATGEALDVFDADITQEIHEGRRCLRFVFQGGPEWLVAFDPEADAIMGSLSATKH